jgi:regulator of chromosome condensation
MARPARTQAAKPAEATEPKVNVNGTLQPPEAPGPLLICRGPPRRVKKPTPAPETDSADADEDEDVDMDAESEVEPAPAKKRKVNASRKKVTIAHKPPAAVNGRAKKAAVPAPKRKVASRMTKRKKHDESEESDDASDAPEPKKAKAAAPAPAAKVAPKKATANKAAPRAPAPVPAPAPAPTPPPPAASAPATAPGANTKEEEPEPVQAKGPRRPRGKKTEINAIRYTDPLKVFVFGEGANGELGFGATKKAIDVKRPRYNEALSKQNVVRIACGGMHVVALTQDNKILTWGVNDSGALGRNTKNAAVPMREMRDGDEESDSDSEDETGGLIDVEATPTPVRSDLFPDDTVFVDVAAGDSCTFALTTEGAVYGWGTFRKNEGILGFSRDVATAHYPVYIEGVTKATQIVCGTNHVFAMDTKHHVFGWGNGQQNQLGRRVTERTLYEALYPTRLGFRDSAFKRPGQVFNSISSGDYHGFALAEDGHTWAWGVNNYCETGNPAHAGADDANILAPKIVASLEGKEVESICAGSHHNIAITKDGQALVWGRCDGSQTGLTSQQLTAIDDEERLMRNNGKPKILIEPTPLPTLKNIVAGACGPDHTIVIDKDGKAYSWGFSANYQTGLGTDDDVDTPTLIDNTAVRDTKLVWAGCGGQYSILASKG